MKESEIQRDIMEELEKRGYLVWRNPTMRYGKNKFIPNGMPDIFFLCGGLLVGVEVKKVGGRTSLEQLAWGDKLQNAGASYCIATCYQDVQEHIRTL